MNEKNLTSIEEKLKEYEMNPDIRALIAKLKTIPGTYIDFIAGVVAYARKSLGGVEAVLNYMDMTDDLTTSDIIRFISVQPDFRDCCVEGGIKTRKGE